MDINIAKVLRSLSSEFDPNSTGEPNLSIQENAVRENVRAILMGYKNGQVVEERELVEGNISNYFAT